MRYDGPAKPIPTWVNNWPQRTKRTAVLLFLIATLLMDLLVWRPG